MSRDAGPQTKGNKKWWVERALSAKSWSDFRYRNGYRRSLRSDYKLNPFKKFDAVGDLDPNRVFAHKWNRRVLTKKIICEEIDEAAEEIDDI